MTFRYARKIEFDYIIYLDEQNPPYSFGFAQFFLIHVLSVFNSKIDTKHAAATSVKRFSFVLTLNHKIRK